jgi:nucleolar protein 6
MGSFQKPQDATRQERKAKKRKLEDAVLDVPSDNEINTEQADGGAGKLAKKWRRDRDADGEGRGLIEDVERKERETTKARWQREANGDATEVSIAEGELTFAKKEKNCRDKKVEEFMTETATAKLVTETQEEAETAPKSKKERKATRRAKDAAEAAKADALSMHGPPIVESRFGAEEKTDGDANTATPEGGKKSKKNNHHREKRLKAATVAPEGSGDISGSEEMSGSKEKKNDRFICFIGTFW